MWYELKIHKVDAQHVDTISEQLEQCNALSITLADQNDNPILEPAPNATPLWPEVLICALFDSKDLACIAQKQVQNCFPNFNSVVEFLEDKVWERECMDQFKPQRFGSRLWICPSWCEPLDTTAINVMLDPGLAFGTGTHPTTALCLEWLEQQPLKHQSLIDFGCGSGILAISAAKLGATAVYAIDIDPQALQATADNATKNLCDAQIHPMVSTTAIAAPCDIIIANILLEPLTTLKDTFSSLLNGKGTLVVSGVLADQIPALIEHYKGRFQCSAQHIKDEWALLSFTHTPPKTTR